MRIISYILFLVLIVVGVTFAYLNSHQVIFNYYFAEKSLPLSLLLIFAVAIGVVLGLAAMGLSWLKLKHRTHKLRKRLKSVEQELENLRSIPLKKENVC